ncbi:hypothetical protein BT67DRAFT_67611 [Trichocladium antarcticum]|uniref:Uncharacterized protein n=1 Tax=Trichocladium antarcticum TaxID=1450529 RepID=A0AAN6UHP9_9PEZI|nr:hypothetical protein BT67DRAFT_67611 [Trichocladium antarcticum]
MKRLPWLVPLLLGGAGANACEFPHKSTANQLQYNQHSILKPPRAIQDHHDSLIELDTKPAISARPNQTRISPPETAQHEGTIPNNIASPPPPPGPEKSSTQHAEPPILDYDPAAPPAASWKEVRNPASANRVIAGMSAGLVGVMVVFTVFL